MNSILFLDIDGVLNPCDGSGLNTYKVELLRHICAGAKCSVVLTSTWRLNDRQRIRVADMLASIGAPLIGVTPDLSSKSGPLHEAPPRWKEIERWIFHRSINAVILDDEKDMGPLAHMHVRPDSHTGLTSALAEEIIRRLNSPAAAEP